MINKPIFFERNRVGRVYLGGKLFGSFFGDKYEDGYEPEEWIASNVKAINKIKKSEKDGVSKIKNQDIYFDDLLKKYPDELLGKNNKFRILVKGLDSAIRLPAQAHPDKEFSLKHFNSPYGKTECWIILDTRPDAKIFFGFKDGVTKDIFNKAIDDSEKDLCAMERLMLDITPKKGDVYFVPAKTVHAIGKGCLILEIQEPTDFTIQPEFFCGEYKLSEKEMFLGLSREDALSCFDFSKALNAKIEPRLDLSNNNCTVERLIDNENTDCFVINRINLTNGTYVINVKNSYGVYVVTEGTAQIMGNDYKKEVKKGDYFFMPYCAMGNFKIKGSAQIIECY